MSELPTCKICGVIVPDDMEHFEHRFLYNFCDTHRHVPPAYIDRARQQISEIGHTQWDIKP